MYIKNNFLLIGNTRLHWAKFINQNYVFSNTLKHEALPKNLNLENLYWSCVGTYDTKIFNQENELKTKDFDSKKIPSNFGIDRVFGCIAAKEIIPNPTKKDILIADLGTTLSITKIDWAGNIIGGQLAPGFLTQLRSMEKSTKNLKYPNKLKIPKKNFLLITEDAMLKGVYNSILGLLKMSFDNNKDILVICGGDSDLFAQEFQFNTKVIFEKNLVMIGMINCFKNFKKNNF